jgi:hypothetical protein
MTIFQDSILVVIFILLFVVFLMVCALIDCVYRMYQAKKHRRQHNTFEIGDLYVFTEKYSKHSVIHKVDSLNSGKGCIRHATDEEIKAGRRL